MATEPPQISKALTKVRDQDGFRWGLIGTDSDIGLIPRDFTQPVQDRVQHTPRTMISAFPESF
jgi:hypothetical protein